MAAKNLTAERVRELLDYDPDTGVFTRKTWRPGAIAGSNHGRRGALKISIDNVQHFAHRIAWIHYYGALPAGQIQHVDGNAANNRIANLCHIPPGGSLRGPVTAERAKEMLDYNPETGAFVWRIGPSRAVKAGAPAGSVNSYGYPTIFLDGIAHKAHRLAWLCTYGEWPKQQIDHINGIKTDNRICNLRDACGHINAQNKRRPQRGSSTGFLGVTPNGNHFTAHLSLNGVRVYLGTYATPEEAHAVYLTNKRILHPGCTI